MGASALRLPTFLIPLLLFLLSLCVGPCAAQSDTALYWSFCYYGSDAGWSVVISGSFLTGPLTLVPWPGISTYQVINAMGIRTAYDDLGNIVSSTNVIGVAPLNITASQNNNNVQTQWPVLDASGIAFLLDANVTIGGSNTSISAISGEPPVEFPVTVTTTTFSYFMYQTGNTATALQCPAPLPLQLVYYYTASDKHTQSPMGLGGGKSLWSSLRCGPHPPAGPVLVPFRILPGGSYCVHHSVDGGRARVRQLHLLAASHYYGRQLAGRRGLRFLHRSTEFRQRRSDDGNKC